MPRISYYAEERNLVEATGGVVVKKWRVKFLTDRQDRPWNGRLWAPSGHWPVYDYVNMEVVFPAKTPLTKKYAN